ncbi:glycosyltransferase family 2 protein [Glaciibacter psychrotolerans]
MIVPVHNVESWIFDCIRSIQIQAIESMEIPVIDDNLTDRTAEFAQSLAESDPRIQVLRSPKPGGASARNFGTSRAQGRYLAFADGDVLVPPGAYSALLRSLGASGSDVAMGEYLTFTPDQAWSRHNNLPIYGAKRQGLTLEDETRLLRDRVCSNKIYDADWWSWNSIEFADSLRSNDIFAMTRTYISATVDIVPDIIYLYRKRVGRTSMTAQRNSLASLHAYFAQEIACWRALSTTVSDYVLEAYILGILSFDVWNHAQTLVDRPSAPVSDAENAVCAQISELIAAAPDTASAELRHTQRWAYRIIESGKLEPMGLLPGHQEFDLMFVDLSHTDEHFSQLELLKVLLGDASAHLFVTTLLYRLLNDLSAAWEVLDDVSLLRKSETLLEFQRRFVARTRLTPFEREAINAAHDHNPDTLRLALGLLSSDINPVGVRVKAIGVMSAEPDLVVSDFLASRHDFSCSSMLKGPRAAEHELSRRRTAGSVPAEHRIRTRGHLFTGCWSLVHSCKRGSAQIQLPAVAEPSFGPATRPSDWALWKAEPTSGNLVLHVKPTAWVRVRPRLGSIKRRVGSLVSTPTNER